MFLKRKILKQLIILFILIFSSSLYANNLRVENITLTGQNTTDHYVMVQFDVSWDNSWRDVVNWDAAWMFVKYQGSSGEWNVAFLSTIDGDHTAPSGSVINNGNDGTGYAPGVFIYRDAIGDGANNWDNIQLRWNYGDNGVAGGELVTVKVFAIEMVYVPQGSFALGDGSGGMTDEHFFDAGIGNTQPFIVNAQSSITTSSSGSGNLWAGAFIDAGTSDADFPTGYSAFYCMKYEISQEQYVDFLNTLNRTQQNTRTGTDISNISVTNRYVMWNNSSMTHRNGIRCNTTLPVLAPITVYCDYDGDGSGNEDNDGQNIACNLISWMDGCAYADWAGLRPISELEYEKACRGGQSAVAGEYAWGNGYIHTSAYTLTNAGYYNEVINGQPSGTGNASNSITCSSINGPLRAGIFALSSTMRPEAGASYYGIMELSGNLYEANVAIGNAEGRTFTGNHGDGRLSTYGNANNVAGWPGWDGSEVTGALGAGWRGGSFGFNTGSLRVSDRILADNENPYRYANHGFRCVRSAP